MFEKIIVPITLAVVAIFVASNIIGFFMFNGFSINGINNRDLGGVTSKQFDVNTFEDISVFTASRVTVVESESNFVTVSGPERLVDNLRVETNREELEIRERSNNGLFFVFGNWGNRNLDITINTTQKISRINLLGSAELKGDDILGSESSVKVSGSGEVDLSNISNKSLDIAVTGSGDISLDGVTNSLDISISGSGETEAYDLLTADANVSITGSGDVKVNASENLTATISGSGDIRYKGNPQVDQKISGSGEIKKAD